MHESNEKAIVRMASRKRGVVFLTLGFGLMMASLIEIALPISGQVAEASTISAASCSFADVSTAIASAQNGDTIQVPSGNCTWNQGLKIDKGIALIGAGADATKIQFTASGEYTITYQPADLSANHPFRVSGFSFDMADLSYGIKLTVVHSSDLTLQAKIRVDHNTFVNTKGQAIWNDAMRGGIDNNHFMDMTMPIRTSASYRNGETWWDNWEGIQ